MTATIQENALAKIDEAKRFLAEARDITDILKIHDMAIAAHAWATARGAQEAAALAIEIKLRAERKGGEFPIGRKEAGTFGSGKKHDTLSSFNLTPKESERWQQMAKIPEKRFEQVLADSRKKTQKAVLQVAKDLAQELNRKDPAKIPVPDNGFYPKILEGDFRFLDELESNFFDLLLTDPPYGEDYLELWSSLGQLAKRVLRPGGWLVSYSGHAFLPRVLGALCDHLSYHWMMALKLEKEHARIHSSKVFTEWKPILVFYKPPREDREIHDMIVSGNSDKRFHEWGQNPIPFEQLLEFFSDQGSKVLDPMAGYGSVVEACVHQNRQVTACDINPEAISVLRKRFDKTRSYLR